jgi:hypothetical protein
MYQIVYVSTVNQDFSAADLKKLLVRARMRNKEAGVTGMLVFYDGTFLQALEGEKGAVASRRIRAIAISPSCITGRGLRRASSATGRWDIPISPALPASLKGSSASTSP